MLDEMQQLCAYLRHFEIQSQLELLHHQVARQVDVIEGRLKEEQETSLKALESLLQQV